MRDNHTRLATALAESPFIAILRGITPGEAEAVGAALIDAGIRIIEVPLTSPDALESIDRLVSSCADRALIGAGTVLDVAGVAAVADCGGQLVVSPNMNPHVIKATVERKLISVPGVATATEALAALDAGADALKIFPAALMPPAAIKALRVVLPTDVLCLPTGGVTAENLAGYIEAGAKGFGIGTASANTSNKRFWSIVALAFLSPPPIL